MNISLIEKGLKFLPLYYQGSKIIGKESKIDAIELPNSNILKKVSFYRPETQSELTTASIFYKVVSKMFDK